MAELPCPKGARAVTFLFTDIEGSTRLWEEQPDAMRQALARHDDLLRAAIERHGGQVLKTTGDGFCAAFPTAPAALAAALDAQLALAAASNGVVECWSAGAVISQDSPAPTTPLLAGSNTPSLHHSTTPLLRVRMALHTGAAEWRDGDYFGPALNRVARLLAAGHGGQVLLSGPAREALGEGIPEGATLQDRGTHRLRDLQEPEQVFQLIHPDLPADFPPLRSLSTHPNNLPEQFTTFIGREREIEAVRALLQQRRLLTLTGSGGCGKTRLSLEVGAALLEEYPDGVWAVELAALSEPELVPQAVAEALGVREEASRSLTQTLGAHLKEKRLLLLLDNCEHLLDAAARLADALLRAGREVKIVATSREPLNIVGEQTYRVPSLSLPPEVESWRLRVERPDGAGRPSGPDPSTLNSQLSTLLESEAAQLFIDRAALQRPDFQVTSAGAADLASLCHRLDGIPLALELAAARVRTMPLAEINQGLDERFRLLTGGSRTALPRQQTLRGLIDWSYDLLGEPEKALLARLSLFAGGWTQAAAEGVCGDCGLRGYPRSGWTDCGLPDPDRPIRNPQSAIRNEEVLDLLTSLADKSLVLAEPREAGTRYRLLETVRQYARDRLEESGDASAWRQRHREYFLALAEEAEPQLRGAAQAEWLRSLDAEHDNLRAALESAVGEGIEERGQEAGVRPERIEFEDEHEHEHDSELPPDPRLLTPGGEAALRLCSAIFRFWEVRGLTGEGRRWCSAALAHPASQGRTEARAKTLNAAGGLAYRQGDYVAAPAFYEQSLAIRRELGDRKGVAVALSNLGNVSSEQGDFPAARALFEESLAIRREVDDRAGFSDLLNNLACVVFEEGDYAAAQALFEEGLAIQREEGDRRAIAWSLTNLGAVLFEQADYAGARALHGESLAIRRELGDRPGIGLTLTDLGVVAGALGDHAAARSLIEEGLAIQREVDDRTGMAVSLTNLGRAAREQGDHASAGNSYRESLALRRDAGDRLGIALSLEGLAAVAAASGAGAREAGGECAAELWGAAERLREEIGSPMLLSDRPRYEREVAAARAAHGDESAFESAWQAGRALTLEQAVAGALADLLPEGDRA